MNNGRSAQKPTRTSSKFFRRQRVRHVLVLLHGADLCHWVLRKNNFSKGSLGLIIRLL